MESAELAVWGKDSTRTLRVHWMLEEYGLDYEYIPIGPRSGETLTQDFLKINPKHKVPVLRHGETVISESAAILLYLNEEFPAPEFFWVPATPLERAHLYEWCFFIMTELDANSLYTIRRHADLSHIYGEAPAAVSAAREYFQDQIGALLQKFPADQEYLAGDQIGVADILLTTCLDWADSYELPLHDRLLRYRDELGKRDAYIRARGNVYSGD